LLQITPGSRPLPGVLFGITHTPDGAPIIREPRVLKVGIGIPKGRGLNVWIQPDGTWALRLARKGQDGRPVFKTATAQTRAEAEKLYREHYPNAAMVPYPQKLSYFTFTRPVLQDDGVEVFEPDFEAIEAHGPTPREIDIVFLDDNAFDAAYQMWSTSELQCKGDGVTARRVLSLAANDEEKALAERAKKEGDKYFPIINGCAMDKCSYRDPVIKGNKEYPSPCKPGGDLKFQLASNIRVGGTAYFHSTGYRSISQIFSSLERIKALTGGRLAGIPLKMVLRPYKTKHNGQAATQFGVGLEFRAEDIQALRKNLMEQAWKFRELATGTVAAPGARHYLDAPSEAAVIEEGDEEAPFSAQAMVNEWHPEADSHEDSEPSEARPASKGAAAATNQRTAELAEKLAQKAKKAEPERPVEAAPAPAPAESPAPPVDDEYRDDPPEDPEDPRFHDRQPGDMI
jgi:hypothetical protein